MENNDKCCEGEPNNQCTLLTAREISTKIFNGKLSYRRILDLCHQGKLGCLRVGRTYYFSEQVVRNWITKNTNSPAWVNVKI